MAASKDKLKEPPLCFVIGPIGKDGSEERKHADLLLHAVVKQVLEADEFGYNVRRADEDADPGMIGDRMISDIIHADLVVADLTGLNPNAFYELGIRHSTEKPTIHIAKLGTVLPFDTVAQRTIFVDLGDWHSIENARKRLAESARTVRKPGHRVSNPITRAAASFKMRESTDPRDWVIADLKDRLTRVEASQRKSADNTPKPSLDVLTSSLHQYLRQVAILGLKSGLGPDLAAIESAATASGRYSVDVFSARAEKVDKGYRFYFSTTLPNGKRDDVTFSVDDEDTSPTD